MSEGYYALKSALVFQLLLISSQLYVISWGNLFHVSTSRSHGDTFNDKRIPPCYKPFAYSLIVMLLSCSVFVCVVEKMNRITLHKIIHSLVSCNFNVNIYYMVVLFVVVVVILLLQHTHTYRELYGNQ